MAGSKKHFFTQSPQQNQWSLAFNFTTLVDAGGIVPVSIVQGRSQQVESIAYSATGIYTIILSNIWVGHLSINPTLQYATLNAGVRFVSFTPSTRTLILNTVTPSTGAALGLSATGDARINVHMDVTDAI